MKEIEQQAIKDGTLTAITQKVGVFFDISPNDPGVARANYERGILAVKAASMVLLDLNKKR